MQNIAQQFPEIQQTGVSVMHNASSLDITGQGATIIVIVCVILLFAFMSFFTLIEARKSTREIGKANYQLNGKTKKGQGTIPQELEKISKMLHKHIADPKAHKHTKNRKR